MVTNNGHEQEKKSERDYFGETVYTHYVCLIDVHKYSNYN